MLVIFAVCIMEALAGNFRYEGCLAGWLFLPGAFNDQLERRSIDFSFENGTGVVHFQNVGRNPDCLDTKVGYRLFKYRGDFCPGLFIERTILDIRIENHLVEILFDLVYRNGEVDVFFEKRTVWMLASC